MRSQARGVIIGVSSNTIVNMFDCSKIVLNQLKQAHIKASLDDGHREKVQSVEFSCLNALRLVKMVRQNDSDVLFARALALFDNQDRSWPIG